MERNEVNMKVKEVLAEVKVLKVPMEEIKDTDHFIQDLNVDSVGMVTILTAVEKKFGIEIPPKDFVLDNFATIELMINYILNKLES